jgi:DNA-directed RNA polymerase subunit RPC12/RpoP
MKKVVLGLVGLVVVVIGGGLLFLVTMKPKQRPAPDLRVELTPERLARGEYLARSVYLCLDCHSQIDTTKYGTPIKPGTEGGGGECFTKENAGFPGTVCAQNITPDKESGVGNWTDGELLRAIREGVSRDGSALFPMMPYQLAKNLSDEDTKSIVAYLRTLKPISNKISKGKAQIDFPVNLFIKFAPQPVETVPEPDRKDSVAYGKYLSYACLECHTPVDDKMQKIAGKEFSGGREFRFGELKVRTANITAHATGIGNRTKEQFVGLFAGWRAVAEHPTVAPKDNTMMPWAQLKNLTDEDLGAIYDFLQTVPKVDNVVQKKIAPAIPPPAPKAEPVPEPKPEDMPPAPT